MDLLREPVRPIYWKYLAAAFGSTLISSIYSIVDMAVVGQYQGPSGAAALAVVAPIWNVIYSLGLLTGIGGSVIFSTKRGSGSADGSDNQYFTAALIGSAILAAAAWAGLFLFEDQVLRLAGGTGELLALAKRYLQPIRWVFPLFLFNQMLSAFLRNDGDPGRATAAVLSGGIFNVFGDCFFTFGLDLGVFGAGFATAIGSAVSFLVLLTHFMSRKNTLRLVRPAALGGKLGRIAATGFSAFFLDVAMGILTVLFNRQIMGYLGSDALAVYGCLINVSTFVQCCAYSVGQAAQPILSVNFGAHRAGRLREVLRLALWTAAGFGVFWTGLSMAAPNLYVRLFMKVTPEVLLLAPGIIRRYALSFLLLPFNIFSTYYFQSILRQGAALTVSLCRGLVVSGALIFLLPALLGAGALWYAMPATELFTAVYAAAAIRRYTRALPEAA